MFVWLLTGVLTLLSTPAFASGNIECKGKTRDGVPVQINWGTSRGPGSARIAPYELTIGDEKPSLKELNEVGYWVGEGRVFVRLVDPNAVESQVLLLTEMWKDGSHGGVLKIGKPTAKAPMKVVVRCEMG